MNNDIDFEQMAIAFQNRLGEDYKRAVAEIEILNQRIGRLASELSQLKGQTERGETGGNSAVVSEEA